MSFLKKIAIFTLLVSLNIYASEEVPTQEEVAKLYVATFNRAPDADGLKYWTNDSGLKLSKIAQSFFDQPETKELYPSDVSNRDFVEAVYKNLFNREPDTAGWNYWENELDKGSFSKNSFIMAIINGAQNNDTSNDLDILSNKTTVGLSFAEAGLKSIEDAKNIMVGVNDDNTTVDSALTSFGTDLSIEYDKKFSSAVISDGSVYYSIEDTGIAIVKFSASGIEKGDINDLNINNVTPPTNNMSVSEDQTTLTWHQTEDDGSNNDVLVTIVEATTDYLKVHLVVGNDNKDQYWYYTEAKAKANSISVADGFGAEWLDGRILWQVYIDENNNNSKRLLKTTFSNGHRIIYLEDGTTVTESYSIIDGILSVDTNDYQGVKVINGNQIDICQDETFDTIKTNCAGQVSDPWYFTTEEAAKNFLNSL